GARATRFAYGGLVELAMTRIGIVYPRSNIDSVPSLIEVAELLGEHGYDVDLMTYGTAPRLNSVRVQHRSLGVDPQSARVPGAAWRMRWIPRIARQQLARTYAAVSATAARGSNVVARARGDTSTYDCVIGVDPDGLVLAHSLVDDVPIAYYSLEL